MKYLVLPLLEETKKPESTLLFRTLHVRFHLPVGPLGCTTTKSTSALQCHSTVILNKYEDEKW